MSESRCVLAGLSLYPVKEQQQQQEISVFHTDTKKLEVWEGEELHVVCMQIMLELYL